MRATGHRLIDADDRRRVTGRVRAGAGLPAAGRDRVPADRVPARGRRDDQVVVRQPQGVLVGPADAPSSRSRSPDGMLDYWRYCRAVRGAAARRTGRRLLLRTARRPRRRPRPGQRHGHQLPRGRIGRLRDLLRRPRPGDRPAVQHAALPAAAPRPVGRPRRRSVAGRQRRRGDAAVRVEPDLLAAHRHPRRRRSAASTLPAGTRIFLNFAVGQPTSRTCSTDPDIFDIHRAEREPAHLLRQGHPLLPRRRAGPDGGPDRARVARRAPPVAAARRRTSTFRYFPNITFRGPDALHSNGTPT